MARARRVLAGGPADLAEYGFLEWWDAALGVVGDLYCTVLEGCQELFDMRRPRSGPRC